MNKLNAEISIYKNCKEKKGKKILMNDFLSSIKLGIYEDEVNKIRQLSSKDEIKLAKNKIFCVTVSGKFHDRNKAGLDQHSGFIAIDFDNISKDMEEIRNKLIKDTYTYTLFTSVSGNGICVIVKIDPERHLEAFEGLYEYYLNTYNFIPDIACKDVARLRFVSYDPKLLINEKSQIFKNYLCKKQPKIPNIFVSKNDITELVNQINKRNVDITEPYSCWVNIAFALVDECDESGRNLFHMISSKSSKYNEGKSDRLYDYCMNRKSSHRLNKITIGTLFYYAKLKGINPISKRTMKLTELSIQAKKQGRNAASVERLLKEIVSPDEEITEEDKSLIKKIFESNIQESSGDQTIFDKLELYIDVNYKLKYNEILNRLEEKGIPVVDADQNSIFIEAKKYVDNKLTKPDFLTYINSKKIIRYNPLQEFIEKFVNLPKPIGNIKKLSETITSDTGMSKGENFFPNYVNYFLEKWLIGIIDSIYGGFSPLLLVLTGEKQNTGKTEWFRRLLPKEFSDYYAESKLDDGKDADIRMCQNILIMDDEMSGKSKQEIKRLKELTSKHGFNIRLPYGDKPIAMKRIAVLCGTSNDSALLSDPTGNRRIIPIHVTDTMNFDLYNSIDKTELLMEVYHLWKSGVKHSLTMDDIKLLSKNTIEFEQIRPEKELLTQFFENPDFEDNHNITLLTATQIKDYIEKNTNQKCYPNKLGIELSSLGYNSKHHRVGKTTERKYRVRYREQKEHIESLTQEECMF